MFVGPATLASPRLHFHFHPQERAFYKAAAKGRQLGPTLALQALHKELGQRMSRKTYRGTPGQLTKQELADLLWLSKYAPVDGVERTEVWVCKMHRALCRLPFILCSGSMVVFSHFKEANPQVVAQAPRRQKEQRRGNAKRQARFAQRGREAQPEPQSAKLTPYSTNLLEPADPPVYKPVLEPLLNRESETQQACSLPGQPPLKPLQRVLIPHPRFKTAPMASSEPISESAYEALCAALPAVSAVPYQDLRAKGVQTNSSLRAAHGLLDRDGLPLTHFRDGTKIKSMVAVWLRAEGKYRPRADGSAVWGIAAGIG